MKNDDAHEKSQARRARISDALGFTANNNSILSVSWHRGMIDFTDDGAFLGGNETYTLDPAYLLDPVRSQQEFALQLRSMMLTQMSQEPRPTRSLTLAEWLPVVQDILAEAAAGSDKDLGSYDAPWDMEVHEEARADRAGSD